MTHPKIKGHTEGHRSKKIKVFTERHRSENKGHYFYLHTRKFTGHIPKITRGTAPYYGSYAQITGHTGHTPKIAGHAPQTAGHTLQKNFTCHTLQITGHTQKITGHTLAHGKSQRQQQQRGTISNNVTWHQPAWKIPSHRQVTQGPQSPHSGPEQQNARTSHPKQRWSIHISESLCQMF